jgi:2-oxoisovalerate dehydrogenase E1 component
MILTEETVMHSLSESLAGRLSEKHFQILDAPIKVIGSKNVPAIPLNQELEKAVLPGLSQITNELKNLLNY